MSVYENVDYDGLLSKMDRKSYVIDVRERHELASTGSIPNSINIPRKYLIVSGVYSGGGVRLGWIIG